MTKIQAQSSAKINTLRSDHTIASINVSIIIPAFNEAKFLDQCIKSILQHESKDIEVIVVDDCSTDLTGTIADGWAASDARVRVLKNEQNQGLPRSLNRGFEESRGKLLSWISGDNWAGPDFIPSMRKAFDTDDDLDIAYGNTVTCNETGQVLKQLPLEPISRLTQINVVRSCFMYRRRVLDRIGPYDPGRALIEDYHFWLRCRQAGLKFRMVAQSTVFHRQHSNSMTARFPLNIARLGLEARSEHLLAENTKNPADILRLIKDIMRCFPASQAVGQGVFWVKQVPARYQPRMFAQIFLELAAGLARGQGK